MMDERRQHERKPIRNEQVRGDFFVEVDGHRHALDGVEDVSISGMGLVLPVQLANGQSVLLAYEDAGECLQVMAMVVWVVASEAGFRTGVHFDTSDMDANVLFFMTLREYIDDFGEAF